MYQYTEAFCHSSWKSPEPKIPSSSTFQYLETNGKIWKIKKLREKNVEILEKKLSDKNRIFSCFFFPNIGMLTNLILLVLENSTNSDRTPPYIDTYLRLFTNFEKFGKNALQSE